MACGSCGQNAATNDVLITWGDGSTQTVGSIAEMRIAKAQQTDLEKVRRMTYRFVPKGKTA